MGCGLTNTTSQNNSQRRQACTLLSYHEYRTLELLFADLAQRNIYANIDQEDFQLLFKKSGLWGEHIFREFDLNNSSFLTKDQFLLGVGRFKNTNIKQKLKLLYQHFAWGQEPPPRPGLLHKNFLKMLCNYPHQELRTILQDEHFFDAKVRTHMVEVKDGLRSIPEQGDENKVIEVYLDDKQTESFGSYSYDSIQDNQNSDQGLDHHSGNHLQFESCGRKINLKINSIHEAAQMFADMVYQEFQDDSQQGLLSEARFYEWVHKNKKVYQSFFGGFLQDIWSEIDGQPSYLALKTEKESKIKLISGREKPKKLGMIFTQDMLLLHEAQNKGKLHKIIYLKGLIVTPVCDRECGNGIRISHRNGVYSEKKIFFKKEQEARQWLDQLKHYNGTNLKDQFKMGKMIASGRYSSVFQCEKILSKKQFAVKQITTYKLSQEEKSILKNQCSILSLLDHPNLPHFQKSFQTKTHQYIVMEKAKGEQLYKYVKQKERLSEFEAKKITKEIICGVKSLHKMGIVHRDLKPDNIMVFNPGEDQKPQVKIVDFGFADYTEKINESRDSREIAVGTPNYIAPQLLYGQKTTEKSDNFSIGSIVFFMLSGMMPFLAETCGDIIEKTKQGAFNFCNWIWKTISKQAKDFIERLLEPQPEKRLDLKIALQHGWMRESTGSNDHSPLTSMSAKKRKIKSVIF